jgi:hypothetical protein
MTVSISINFIKNQVKDMNLVASVVFQDSWMNFHLSYNAIVFVFVILDLKSVKVYYYCHNLFLNMTRHLFHWGNLNKQDQCLGV